MTARWIDQIFGLIESNQSQSPLTLKQRLATWTQRAASRRELAQMEDHLLKDIGLTRQQAMREASRPFYDGEARLHWRRPKQGRRS